MNEYINPPSVISTLPKRRVKIAYQTRLKLAFLLLLIVIAAITFKYYQMQQYLKKLQTPEGQAELAKLESSIIIENVRKLTLLPPEEPVLATIIDAGSLVAESPFYQGSEDGDQLLVFPQAQKAYIYSPKRNIIVNVGPLVVTNSPTPLPNPQSTILTSPLTLEIRNGSNTPGKANQLRTQLDPRTYVVSSVTTASHTDYVETLVIQLKSSVTNNQMQSLAESVSGHTQTSLPPGESASGADVLIIVGNGQ